MPFELRPSPTPALRPEGSYLQNAWTNSVYPLARRMGVEIKLPTVSPQPRTRLAFQGLEFAKDRNAGAAYNDGVMRAFFQRSENIGEVEVLTAIAVDAGLPGDAFRAALDEEKYAARVRELLRFAMEDIGVTGVPLFLVGEVRLTGVQSRQTLASVIEQQLSSGPRDVAS